MNARTGPRTKRVTIHAVAKAAGVSTATVSNVFNDRDDRVAPATRDTVLRVAAELGYRPNRIAMSLVTRRTATIGLIVSEITNPLYPPAIQGVERQAKAMGWHVILSTADDVPAQMEAAELLLDRNVDGLIVFATSQLADDRYLSDLAASGIPMVTINRVIDDPRVGQVRFDNRGGAAVVVEHLIHLGHTRIAHIAGPRTRLNARLRLEGYRAMLDRHGLPVHDDYMQESDYSFASGVSLTRALLACRPAPTAIFAASGEGALGALRALHAAGLRVPEDLSLATFGNPEFLGYSTPTITTVNLPVVEAGVRAAQLVIDRIAEQQDTAPPPITLPADLVIGASTAPPP